MPFNGSDYDEIVLKNLESDIDFDFDKLGVQLSKECELISHRFNQKNAFQESPAADNQF